MAGLGRPLNTPRRRWPLRSRAGRRVSMGWRMSMVLGGAQARVAYVCKSCQNSLHTYATPARAHHMIRYLKQGKDVKVRADDDAKVRATVEGIIADVQARGDDAVRDYSRKFDDWDPADFRLSRAQIEAARKALSA